MANQLCSKKIFKRKSFFRTQLGNLAKNIKTERSPTNGLY